MTFGSFPAPQAALSNGYVYCNAGEVIYGGGLVYGPLNLLGANINSSFLTDTSPTQTWIVYADNFSGMDLGFSVSAVCGPRPLGYKVVTSANVPNPSGSQTRASASCPKKHQVLSGGAYSIRGYPQININSSYPSGRKWIVAMN
jgi:hypothetical protein